MKKSISRVELKSRSRLSRNLIPDRELSSPYFNRRVRSEFKRLVLMRRLGLL